MKNQQIKRKSIFDLERRIDLNREILEFETDIKRSTVLVNAMSSRAVINVLNESIQDWPYREGARSVSSYFEKKFYDLNMNLLFSEEERAVFRFELYINLLYWAPSHFNALADPFDFNLHSIPLDQSLGVFIENITFLLEKINMKVRKIETSVCPKYVITKRDADVDLTIEAAPELSELLLSYLDFRNQNDENFKKNTIKAIADYLEPMRGEFKGTGYRSLSDDVFKAFNILSIRHNNSKQKEVKQKDRIKLYDALFRMSLHLIQKNRVDECQSFVQSILTEPIEKDH